MKILKHIWVLLNADIEFEFAFEMELPGFFSTWGFAETNTDTIKAVRDYYGCIAALYINLFIFEFRVFLK